MHRHVSKVSVIPIVADALVAISKDARTWQEKLGFLTPLQGTNVDLTRNSESEQRM